VGFQRVCRIIGTLVAIGDELGKDRMLLLGWTTTVVGKSSCRGVGAEHEVGVEYNVMEHQVTFGTLALVERTH